MALRELLPVLAEDVRCVRVDGELRSECLEHDNLLRRVRDVVVAADDVRDPVDPVVDRRGVVVHGPTVGAQDDHVLELIRGKFDPALDRIVPPDHALLRHANPDRAVVLVRLALDDEACRLDPAALGAVELEARLAVPVDPEPAQRLLDLRDRVHDLATRVGVLDSKKALAPVAAREEPVEQERANASDVEEAGRTRCHADADAHQAGIVGINGSTVETHM